MCQESMVTFCGTLLKAMLQLDKSSGCLLRHAQQNLNNTNARLLVKLLLVSEDSGNNYAAVSEAASQRTAKCPPLLFFTFPYLYFANLICITEISVCPKGPFVAAVFDILDLTIFLPLIAFVFFPEISQR
jgi:hypothetical protein